MKVWTYIEKTRRKYIARYTREIKHALIEALAPLQELYINNIDAEPMIDPKPIMDVMVKLYGDVGKEFAGNVRNLIIKKYDDLDLWEQYMQDWAINNAAAKVVSIAGTMTEELKRLIRMEIAAGVQAGKGTYEIAKMIRENVPNQWAGKEAVWKSKRIAQTEVIGASNRAAFDSAKQFGYAMKKTWLPAPFGVSKNERHTLPGALVEYTIPLDQQFVVFGEKMDCPGDSSHGATAGNIINCKCAITFEVI